MEDVLPGTQVAGTGRLPYLMDGESESRAFAELLIDCEKDRILRAVLVGMLQDATAIGRTGLRVVPHGGRLN